MLITVSYHWVIEPQQIKTSSALCPPVSSMDVWSSSNGGKNPPILPLKDKSDILGRRCEQAREEPNQSQEQKWVRRADGYFWAPAVLSYYFLQTELMIIFFCYIVFFLFFFFIQQFLLPVQDSI